MMQATVLLAKCGTYNRTYGIRVEKRDNDWIRTWAFKIDDAQAKREGFDGTQIRGTLDTDLAYPGCPHCEAKDIVCCGTCDRMICYPGGETIRCNWCGTVLTGIRYVDEFDVSTGGY